MQYERWHDHALIHVQTINQSINNSKHCHTAAYATNESEAPNKSFNLSVTVIQNDQ